MAMKKLLPLIAFIILLFFPNYVHCAALSSLVTNGVRVFRRATKSSFFKILYKEAGKSVKNYFDQFSSSTKPVVPYSNVTYSYDSGVFNMDIYMGTPYNSLNLSIDTFNELLWVQCQLVQSSTTYQKVSCSDFNNTDCYNGNNLYNSLYNSTGFSSQDVVSFDGFEVSDSKIVRHYKNQTVRFGCESDTQGVLTEGQISALAGLNRGNRSMASMLGKKFSYCLPTLDSTGFISFFYPNASTAALNYTPMLDGYGDYYVLELESITVDAALLNISQPNLNNLTVIVTTSLFSYFGSEIYQSLESILDSSMDSSLQKIGAVNISEDFQLEVCYNFSSADLPTTPNVSFVFKGGQAVLELDNVNLLYPFNESVVCFAFVDLGVDGYNIIGSYQLTNHVVEHDNDKMQIGFAKYDNCSLSYQQSSALGNAAALLHLLASTFIAIILFAY